MEITLNRSIVLGLGVALLTALTALWGAPTGFSGFRLPIWELLLQFNFCTGFVILILGVLESVETPVPDLRAAVQLLLAGFAAYFAICFSHLVALGIPFSMQLFVFAFSLACVGAGWARFGLSVLKALDAAD